MFSIKRFAILIIIAVITSATAAAQQREMTAVESYLQESIEVMVIRETARGNTREQKLLSLKYIEEVVARDKENTNDEIRQTLDYLSREGRRSVARERGRVVNNFPEIRMQSAILLGQIGTEEARKTLIDIIQFENEPMVIQAAVRSLGNIGTNENNETVATIAWVFERFNNLNPDNLMADAVLEAFEKIAKQNDGINSPAAVRTLMRISEGHYITPIKTRARDLIAELRSYGK